MKRTLVFHGTNASSFHDGFSELLEHDFECIRLSDALSASEIETFQNADVIIGTRLDDTMPYPERAALYQVAGAGTDGIDISRLKTSTALCNCYGHAQPIGEYVIGALINSRIPYTEADARLRQQDWRYQSGRRTHGELHGSTLGILGFGNIGQYIAKLARGLGMRIHVGNRSAIGLQDADAYFDMTRLGDFYGSIDDLVVALPSNPQTIGLVDAEAFASLSTNTHVINVGRGEVIDEQALYDALRTGQIRGATIDTWYRYPATEHPRVSPASLPFHELDNVVMTPHMSGWTQGTIERRRQTMADNVNRWSAGRQLTHVVRPGKP